MSARVRVTIGYVTRGEPLSLPDGDYVLMPATQQGGELPQDELLSKDNCYSDPIEDIAHALAQELEDAELDRDDFVTVNREKLSAIAGRVLEKAEAALAQRAASVPAEAVQPVARLEQVVRPGGTMSPPLFDVVILHRAKCYDQMPLYAAPMAATVQDEPDLVKRLKHERDALGQAIADAAQKAGMYNGDVPLSGPHLIMFAQHLGDAATVPQDIGRDAALNLIIRDVAELDYSSDINPDLMQVSAADLRLIIQRHATPPANVAQAAPQTTEKP